MKRYKRLNEANFKGNFYAQKGAIKQSFRMLKVIEQIQDYFEKEIDFVTASITATTDSANVITKWNLTFKTKDGGLNPVIVEQIKNDILEISSVLECAEASENLFIFTLEL